MSRPNPPRRGTAALLAAGLALAPVLAGCSTEEPASIGYRHSGDATLRVLLPVCPGEEVTQARVTGGGEVSTVGVDVPAEDGTVDLLIGYPGDSTAASPDLRLDVTTSRLTYTGLAIPPVERGRTPTGDDWLTAGTGEPTTRQGLLDSRTC